MLYTKLSKLNIVAILTIMLASFKVYAVDINVGGYAFPPFLEKNKSGIMDGVTLDLINMFNDMQDTFVFKFVPTSPRRKFQDFNAGKFDLIFFEDKAWGWKNSPVDSSKPFLSGGELYVALKESSRNQDYFKDLKDKTIIGILGYHYGFANFNSDLDYLKKNFNINLKTSHEGSINMLLLYRGDVAVVTEAFLLKYMAKNPDAKDKLLISDKYDQEYNHTILVRSNATITVDEINQLLSKAYKDNLIQKVWSKYNLQEKAVPL